MKWIATTPSSVDLLDQPGSAIGLRCRDEDLDRDLRFVGRGRVAQAEARGTLVDAGDLRPAGVPLAVDHPQALAGLEPLHLEQVVVRFAFDERCLGRKKDR